MAQSELTGQRGQAETAAASVGPYLILALECARPLAGSERLSLVGVDEVRIGRGAARAHRRSDEQGRRILRVEVPDIWMSTEHCRLFHGDARHWIVEDAGSKNGIAVNGERVERARLRDGDVLEIAKTMFLLRAGRGARGAQIDPGDLALGVAPAPRGGDAPDSLDPWLAAVARRAGQEVDQAPLRRRRDDLGLLIGRTLARLAGADADRVRIARSAARALLQYDWPFDVAELEQALGAALASAPSHAAEGERGLEPALDLEIGLVHLPPDVRAAAERHDDDTTAVEARGPHGRPARPTPEELEALLREHRGNVSAVAELLRTSRSQVRRLAKRFGLVVETFR